MIILPAIQRILDRIVDRSFVRDTAGREIFVQATLGTSGRIVPDVVTSVLLRSNLRLNYALLLGVFMPSIAVAIALGSVWFVGAASAIAVVTLQVTSISPLARTLQSPGDVTTAHHGQALRRPGASIIASSELPKSTLPIANSQN